jgi:beta-lactamase class A
MLKRKIPLFYLLFSTLFGAAIGYFVFLFTKKDQPAIATIINDGKTVPCNYNIVRYGDYKYIHPLLTAEPECESEKYAPIKNQVYSYIESERQDGKLASVSVYLRDFRGGEWMVINPERRYEPGSLLKVGVLLTYLHMAEADPGLLNKEYVYHNPRGFSFPVERYRSDTIVDGRKYKVKDLLHYMITFSDNRSTLFLENMMDTAAFKKQFSDLGMSEPHFQNEDYMLNVKEYATFMKALYNASYLTPAASEYANTLLTQSTFKEGLVKELPADVKVAHKFGEAGDMLTHELHESGIIYLDKNPYLLTVMTMGKDWDKQAQVISHISKMVYDFMSQNHGAVAMR